MNAQGVTDQRFTRVLRNILVSGAILLVVLSYAGIARSAGSSPFIGHWLATDVDGSEMALTLAGRPEGPFQVTWTDDYISYCNGEAGILRGTGWLNESDANLLEADVLLVCFTTGGTLDIHVTLRHHPGTDTLSIQWDFGPVTIWHRPGKPQPLPPPLNLRINYGDDWVESFYEAGHVVWITVTGSDGVTVKATTEVFTESRDEWGGEEGFQTTPEGWDPGPPDIQPFDWVFGWVDNGASARVQIGEISGGIDLLSDSIAGTVDASWFSDEVEVECLPWGAPKALDNVTYGMVAPDNLATYSCSWAGEWNILPGQTIGVGYYGPDGHWVANAFAAYAPQIVASESGDWFWTTGFIPGPLDLSIYGSAGDADPLWQSDNLEADEDGFVFVGQGDHGQDLIPGNYIVVSDGNTQKELVLASISVDIFDTENESMAGTASPGSEVWAAAGPMEWQERLFAPADSVTGAWLADFNSIGFDITEDMRPWSYAHVYDGDGDANEGSTPPPAAEVWHRLNPDQSNSTPEHEVLSCGWNDGGWSCYYYKQPARDLGFEDPPDSTYGRFVGQDVTAAWACPEWFPSNFCENLLFVASGVMSLNHSDGTWLEVNQDLIVAYPGEGPILFAYWTDQGFYCPWYEDFDAALAANPFPTPFNGEDWPEMDCVVP